MEETITKPDVVLVTKNVMVPFALPPSANKVATGTSQLKKKSKIVKIRRNNTSESVFHDNNCKRSESQKKNYHSETEFEAIRDVFFHNEILSNTRNFQNQNDSEETIRNFENLYTSGELTNFGEKSDTTYEIPYNHGHIELGATSWRPHSEQLISSINPVAAIPKEISKFSHRTMLLPSFSGSLKSSEKFSVSAKSSCSKISQQEGSEDHCKIIINSESSNNETASRTKSSAEHVSCLLSNVNSSYCEHPDVQTENHNECKTKYSWEDLENWIPPSQKKNLAMNEKKSEISLELSEDRNLACRVKYSWQIIGTAVQTSEDLTKNLVTKENEDNENYPCAPKYSWQIIGTGTQVSFRESARDPSKYESDYWDGKILKGRTESKNVNKKMRVSPKCKIFYNQQSQTTSDKVLQADTSDCEAKYSWQNLTKPYLQVARNF